MSEPENRPRLGEIIEALHDSEINGWVSWIFDGTWNGAGRRMSANHHPIEPIPSRTANGRNGAWD
jgi:hypothetical protein